MWWIIGGIVFLMLAMFCWLFIAGTDQSRKRAIEAKKHTDKLQDKDV